MVIPISFQVQYMKGEYPNYIYIYIYLFCPLSFLLYEKSYILHGQFSFLTNIFASSAEASRML